MQYLQRAVFIGVMWGIVLIVLLASLAGPHLAFASTQEVLKPGSGIFAPLINPSTSAGQDQAAPAPEAAGQPNPTAEPQVEPVSQSSSSSCVLNDNFPESVRRWCSSIERAAGEAGLDPNLVAAVMLQESGGDPNATSHSGAVGLLQVMPRDGIAASFQCVNGPCFRSRPSMAELYDPEFNLSYGTRMLAGLVQKYGNSRDGLRYYGPGDAGYSYADKVLAIVDRYR